MPDEPVPRRELQAYIDAHTTLHLVHDSAHSREHTMTDLAISKAEGAMDRRLEGMNEVRAQLREQAATFVRSETFQALVDRVIAIEKHDVKDEGRSLGQGAVVAIIVAAVGVVGTILGILVVVANFASAS